MRVFLCLLGLLALPAHAQSVGRIAGAANPEGGHCSGTLIAPALVLTAAHCVAVVEGSGIRVLDGQVFVLDHDGGREIATIAAVAPHPGLRAMGPRLSPAQDMALAVLDSPLEAEPVVMAEPRLDGPMSFVSYRRESPQERLRQDFCYGSEAPPYWQLGCRVTAGQSGGAVLSDNKLMAVIVARQGAALALALPLDDWALGAPQALAEEGRP